MNPASRKDRSSERTRDFHPAPLHSSSMPPPLSLITRVQRTHVHAQAQRSRVRRGIMNRRSVVQQRSLALALAHTELVEHARHRRARTSSCNSRSLVKVLGRRDDRRRVAACSGRLGVSFLVRARHDSAPNIMPASAERPSILLPAGWAGSGGRDGRGEGGGGGAD